MRYICTNCTSYIYDEALWDKYEEISPGTKFEDFVEGFVCPSCYESSDFFHEIKDEVNYPNNPNNLTPIEKEHRITYKIDWNILEVWVDEGQHSMTDDHYIAQIALYDEDGELIEERFLTPEDDTIIQFDLDYLTDFEIRVKCSQHWVWWTSIIHL